LLVEVDLIKSTETCQCTLNQGLHLLVSYWKNIQLLITY
jgi:hypothetical protein